MIRQKLQNDGGGEPVNLSRKTMEKTVFTSNIN